MLSVLKPLVTGTAFLHLSTRLHRFLCSELLCYHIFRILVYVSSILDLALICVMLSMGV